MLTAEARAWLNLTDEGNFKDEDAAGKPRSQERRHDRDHDHVTGLPRGLACAGNSGCNALMPRQLTLPRARLIVAYLERVEAHYASREAVAS